MTNVNDKHSTDKESQSDLANQHSSHLDGAAFSVAACFKFCRAIGRVRIGGNYNLRYGIVNDRVIAIGAKSKLIEKELQIINEDNVIRQHYIFCIKSKMQDVLNQSTGFITIYLFNDEIISDIEMLRLALLSVVNKGCHICAYFAKHPEMKYVVVPDKKSKLKNEKILMFRNHLFNTQTELHLLDGFKEKYDICRHITNNPYSHTHFRMIEKDVVNTNYFGNTRMPVLMFDYIRRLVNTVTVLFSAYKFNRTLPRQVRVGGYDEATVMHILSIAPYYLDATQHVRFACFVTLASVMETYNIVLKDLVDKVDPEEFRGQFIHRKILHLLTSKATFLNFFFNNYCMFQYANLRNVGEVVDASFIHRTIGEHMAHLVLAVKLDLRWITNIYSVVPAEFSVFDALLTCLDYKNFKYRKGKRQDVNLKTHFESDRMYEYNEDNLSLYREPIIFGLNDELADSLHLLHSDPEVFKVQKEGVKFSEKDINPEDLSDNDNDVLLQQEEVKVIEKPKKVKKGKVEKMTVAEPHVDNPKDTHDIDLEMKLLNRDKPNRYNGKPRYNDRARFSRGRRVSRNKPIYRKGNKPVSSHKPKVNRRGRFQRPKRNYSVKKV